MMDLLVDILSPVLWVSEQSLHLAVFMTQTLLQTTLQLLTACLSWTPDIVGGLFQLLYSVVSVFVYVLEHLAVGAWATLTVCYGLALSLLSEALTLSVLAFSIGCQGVYTLFSLVYSGVSVCLSVAYHLGGHLLYAVVEAPWSTVTKKVVTKVTDSVKVDSLSDAVELWRVSMLNVFYLFVGVMLVTWIYYLSKWLFKRLHSQEDDAQNRPTTPRPTPATPARRRGRESVREPVKRSEEGLSRRLQRGSDNTDSPVTPASGPPRPPPSRNTGEQEGSVRAELSRLNTQLAQEKDKNLCVVCLDHRREVLLKPCNHYCLCLTCIRSLRNCPVCTQRISRSEKIFHV